MTYSNDKTNASDDSILILEYLILSRKISDLIKKSLDSYEYLTKIKLQKPNNPKEAIQWCSKVIIHFKRDIKELKMIEGIQRTEGIQTCECEAIEFLKEEIEKLKNIKEEIAEFDEEIADIKTSIIRCSSIKKIEICLDHDNNISIKEYNRID